MLNFYDTFYEIKTYPSVRVSVRQAIGQLFEYATWMEKDKTKELIVITQPIPDKEFESIRKYFTNIRRIYHIPLYYQYFDKDTSMLSEKV